MPKLDYQYLATVVQRAQGGDSDAFAELYAATYQKQYSFACSYLKDTYLAQDAVNETYIAVLKGLDKLKDPRLFISWLNQISFRVCFQIQKRQNRFNEESALFQDAAFSLSDEDRDPEFQMVSVDEQEYLLKQIVNLPFSESQAITLKYLNNMSLDDIADIMDVSRSSVKRYLASGKAHLSKILQKG
jgi:RNA polymerase sigma-70 factor (ECF subfamily)